jgi:hypothetical protein
MLGTGSVYPVVVRRQFFETFQTANTSLSGKENTVVKLLGSIGFLSGLLVATLAVGQEDSGLKHLVVPVFNDGHTVTLTAQRIEKGIPYPSVIKLAGSVEIKSQACLPVGKEGRLICDGYTIVRADEAEFHEDTGQIEAHGNVSITPLQHEKKK